MKTKQIKQLTTLFKETTKEDEQIISKKIYMDAGNVCGFIPKTKRFEEAIKLFFDTEGSEVPRVDYETLQGETCTAKYSSDYLKIVLAMCTAYESVKLTIKKDYPLKAETTDFIFLLAPRVDNDD